MSLCLIKDTKGCEGCVLHETGVRMGSHFTEVEGKGSLGVLIVGEASGEAENSTGLPFRPKAQAGSVLEEAIRRSQFVRDQFWVTNILRCRPPNNWLESAPWEKEAIAYCRVNLDEVINKLKPKAILTLGGIATRELTGLNGPKMSISYIRGYTLPSRYGVPVIPSFHPAFLARGASKYMGLLMRDLGRAVQVAHLHSAPCLDLGGLIRVETSLDALRTLYEEAKADPDKLIAYDLETDESPWENEDEVLEFNRDMTNGEEGEEEEEEEENSDDEGKPNQKLLTTKAHIRTIQFAISDEWGVDVRWEEGYKEMAATILALPNPKVAHNGHLFDIPVLRRHGIEVKGALLYDSLIAFRNLQPDLPAHLQAVTSLYWPQAPPWKHLAGTSPELYGVMDVCALIRIMKKLPEDMKSLQGTVTSVWEGYTKYTLPFLPVLDDMTKRGLPVSKERLDILRAWLNAEIVKIDKQIQIETPEAVKGFKPMKVLPKVMKFRAIELMPDLIETNKISAKTGRVSVRRVEPTAKKVYETLSGESPVAKEVLLTLAHEFGHDLAEKDGRIWLGKRNFFNPRSPKQMLSYLKYKGYKIPIKFKDGKKTTNDKEMERLWVQTGDSIIKLSREKRVTSKMIDSYTGKKNERGVAEGGWIPGNDGKLRATFGFTSNWQLSAKNPNVLTLPKRRPELAKKFRECIVAEPGYRLIEFDYSAFHARTTGLEAQDALYMDLAAKDIHSFVTGHLVKWPGIELFTGLSDDDQRGILAEIKAQHKDIRNFKAKPSILGIGFGMGYRRLYFENRESFSAEAEAKRLLDLIRALFPKVFTWQERVCEEADRTGRLISKWGGIRWFWEVYKWQMRDGRWGKFGGRDAEKAKAFLPANDAHGMLRLKLIEMEEKGWLRQFGLVNIVHDALVFHCPILVVDDCLQRVGDWLIAPVMQLADPIVAKDGFNCGIEKMVGANLGEMEVVV